MQSLRHISHSILTETPVTSKIFRYALAVTDTTAAPTIALETPFAPLAGRCELVLVRHGEQLLTKEMSVSESIDPPLSELGERQAAAVGQRLAMMQVDAIYSSPLRRAFQTGEAIGRFHG